MEFLRELFLTAFMAVVFSLIVAASIAFSGGNEKASSSSVVKTEEKRLKVVGVKSKKKVKFMDEVVVRDVDEKPSNDLKFLEKFDGFLGNSLEEEICRDEVNIVKMFDTLDHEEVDEEAETIVSVTKIVEGIGYVKIDDVEEEEIFESNHFQGNSQMFSEIESITGLNMVDDDDVSTNQKGVEESGKDCIFYPVLDANETDNTDNSVKETEISTFDGGLENLSVEENSRNQALALPENEEVESNVVATKADEGTVRFRYGEYENDKEGGDEDEDDDWEGIERSELEKVFAKAVNYVEYGGKDKDKDKDDQLSNLGSNVQIQLYGLHKLAVEGPCYEPQPMALKVSARAKWNSWQKLGSMSPELAMEQYIKLLAEADSEWGHHSDAGGLTRSESVGGLDTGLAEPKELQADDDEEGGRSKAT